MEIWRIKRWRTGVPMFMRSISSSTLFPLLVFSHSEVLKGRGQKTFSRFRWTNQQYRQQDLWSSYPSLLLDSFYVSVMTRCYRPSKFYEQLTYKKEGRNRVRVVALSSGLVRQKQSQGLGWGRPILPIVVLVEIINRHIINMVGASYFPWKEDSIQQESATLGLFKPSFVVKTKQNKKSKINRVPLQVNSSFDYNPNSYGFFSSGPWNFLFLPLLAKPTLLRKTD